MNITREIINIKEIITCKNIHSNNVETKNLDNESEVNYGYGEAFVNDYNKTHTEK